MLQEMDRRKNNEGRRKKEDNRTGVEHDDDDDDDNDELWSVGLAASLPRLLLGNFANSRTRCGGSYTLTTRTLEQWIRLENDKI